MSRNASRRVSFSPDINERPAISFKHNCSARVAGNRKRIAGICSYRLPKSSGFSPVRFLWRLGAKVAKALRLVSIRRRSSSKVSSSNSISRPSVAPLDSHRAEAIEDCIEFINSSSLKRSNSVSANSY